MSSVARSVFGVLVVVLSLAGGLVLVLSSTGDPVGLSRALAQGGDAVWHEYVPDVESSAGSAIVSGSGAVPTAIVHDGEIITAPEGGVLRSGERAMRAAPGDSALREEEGRRSPTFRPDRVTSLTGSVGYYEIFSPSIRPYKRVTALDTVIFDPTNVPILAVADTSRVRVPVEGASAVAPDLRPRDRFWGSVVLDFAEGSVVPLPSVSPEARVLALRTEPVTPLHIERDPADNFFAVLDGPAPPGGVRVVFLTDAPRSYFGFEEGASLPSVPVPTPARPITLPPRVREDALTFARELGLSPDSPFDRIARTLAEHFRSFEERDEPPPSTGNIFLDLARGRIGVCRHRAYAYVVTALALGVEARFVENEAHAWVEIRLPAHRGWSRVDLGGSAAGLTEHRADRDGPEYQPDVTDPFPQPEPYRRALEAAARASLARAEETAGGASGGASGGAGAGDDGWTPATDASEESTDFGPEPAEPAPSPTPAPSPAPAPARRPLALFLDGEHAYSVTRGGTLTLTGTAASMGGAAPGVRVEVLLLDRARSRERLLGVTVSAETGVFLATVGVPQGIVPGEYELVVRSPGSATYLAATAR